MSGLRWVAWGLAMLLAASGGAQDFDEKAVFSVRLEADREPLVAGEELRLAVVISIDRGWHVNSHDPGDDFSVPTSLDWQLPPEWPEPMAGFPVGREISFAFSDTPLQVWDGRVVIVAASQVPAATASGVVELAVEVTAQACNDTQCLPPVGVAGRLRAEVAPAGSASKSVNEDLFAATVKTVAGSRPDSPLQDRSLPLLLLGVFFAGLALNLTPCVFPLIPITVGFFARQKQTSGRGAFVLALAYVLGMAVTYSLLGVAAAMTGALFGAALQSPWVVGLIVVVVLALAASMFGAWEIGIPAWAQGAGGRSGVLGAVAMGLVMGFVAAPCIGPFVLGLLTFVGQRGDPMLGFVLFFTLALGLGLPYLLLGTFTGLANRLPASGMWMVGVRRVFGVLLVAMAAYFAAPLLPGDLGSWLMGGALALGALYLLVVDRTGHEQPAIDRVMRLACTAMLIAGIAVSPLGTMARSPTGTAAAASEALAWTPFDDSAVAAAVAGGGPVILDFYADWCAPCRELDEKTFADPRVAAALGEFARFKVDLTRSNDANQRIANAYGVRGVPTVIVYRGGEERFRLTGFEAPGPFLRRLE